MLTKRQAELLAFVHRQIEGSGVCPSFVEMMQATGLRSRQSIFRLLNALQRRGFIQRIPAHARSIEVLRVPAALAAYGTGVAIAAPEQVGA